MNSRILLIILSAAAISLSSCSVLNKIGAPKDTSKKTDDTEVRKVTVKHKKGETPTVTLPQPPAGNVQAPKPEELTGGEWTVVSVGEININDVDEVPFVNFDARKTIRVRQLQCNQWPICGSIRRTYGILQRYFD